MGRAYAAIGIVTVLWATNFTVGKIGTREIDPFFIASCRIVVSGIVFWALLSPEDRRIRASDLRAILPLAITGMAVNQICFACGIQRTTPSHSAIIHALIPVVVSVVAWIVIRERLGAGGVFGMALAVAGALVVVLGAKTSEFAGTIWGDLLTAVGITAFSIYTVLGRRLLHTMGSFRVLALAFVLAAPLMAPLMVWSAARQDWAAVTWKGWGALAYMLVCANMISYGLHIFALSRLRAGQVAAFTDLQPAIGIGVAVLAGEDVVSATLVAGAALALAGVVLVQIRR
jgi:drug/metabolite transporter (DMT)-like permease